MIVDDWRNNTGRWYRKWKHSIRINDARRLIDWVEVVCELAFPNVLSHRRSYAIELKKWRDTWLAWEKLALRLKWNERIYPIVSLSRMNRGEQWTAVKISCDGSDKKLREWSICRKGYLNFAIFLLSFSLSLSPSLLSHSFFFNKEINRWKSLACRILFSGFCGRFGERSVLLFACETSRWFHFNVRRILFDRIVIKMNYLKG